MNLSGWLLVIFLSATAGSNANPSGPVVVDATCSVGTRGGGSASTSSKVDADACLLYVSGGATRGPVEAAKGDANLLECPAGTGGDWESAQANLRRYLDNVDARGGEFLIQGWRWHTMALAREAHRLHVLGLQMSSHNSNNATDQGTAALSRSVDVDSLKKAADYVVGFNMKGLHRIERDVFFPWVRKHVVEPLSRRDSDASHAVSAVLDRLETQQVRVEKLGQALNQAAARASDSQPSVLEEVSDVAAEIAQCARSMIQTEDSLLVPTIASFVPGKEQRQLNDRVIRSLGVWDSRLHLVGMYEAVWETNDEREKQLFRSSIPSLPQRMIPRWKRLLYEPRAGALSLL